jgi:hypothetical protein
MKLSERDRKNLEYAKKTAAQVKKIDELRKASHTASEIAEIMGLPESRIRYLIERYY